MEVVFRSPLKKENLKADNQRITIEQYNHGLDKDGADINSGEFYRQEEAEKISGLQKIPPPLLYGISEHMLFYKSLSGHLARPADVRFPFISHAFYFIYGSFSIFAESIL